MNGDILIVDDEPEMLSLLQTDLELRGFAVTTAATADDALELLRDRAFDAVLTDIFMPGINGIEFCDRLTANNPDVPAIVMTAFGSMETAVEALRVGAFDFVTKPLDSELVVAALRRAVEHSQLARRVRLLSHPVDADGEFEDDDGQNDVANDPKPAT